MKVFFTIDLRNDAYISGEYLTVTRFSKFSLIIFVYS